MTEIYGIMAQLRAQAQQGEGSDKQILNTMTTRDKDKPLQCLHLHNNSMKVATLSHFIGLKCNT